MLLVLLVLMEPLVLRVHKEILVLPVLPVLLVLRETRETLVQLVLKV